MNSKELKNYGFTLFGNFSLMNFNNIQNKEALNFTGLYALILGQQFFRLKGDTDILYIGQSGGSKNGKGRFIFERLKDYCVGASSAPQDERIHNSLKKVVEVYNKEIKLFYKQALKKNCKNEESKLLDIFNTEHLELPPFNRQS